MLATGHNVRGLLSDYLVKAEDPKPLKVAAVFALLAHFVLFLVVIQKKTMEPIRIGAQMASIVVKRYKPPAPPSRKKKTRKKAVNPVPIPDPTPDEPEPIEDQAADVDFGDPEADFLVGLPDAPPGLMGSAWNGAFRMGEGGVIPPILLKRVLPEYTPQATRAGIQGEVYIEAVVTVDGQVAEPKLIRGLPDKELNQRAMNSILRWQFKPGIKDGTPVPVIALFTVTFRIH
ncbi:MAG: energy transducer TonB [Acidobacteriota bacterium]